MNRVYSILDAVIGKLGSKLSLSGGTMTGALNMGSKKITGLGVPTASTDAATKGYVDSAVLIAYPVGSIYISSCADSPAGLFGGTWERLKDRFLLGCGDTYTEPGCVGGEETHTLTVEELPSHWHNQSLPGRDAGTGWYGAAGTAAGRSLETEATGGGLAHNNMPPYRTVYMWQRTA